jgi:hypothetical protein
MSASTDRFTPAVCEILDLFYERDGEEPDWAAIQTRLYSELGEAYVLPLQLLQALWTVYEDAAAFETLAYHLKVVTGTE